MRSSNDDRSSGMWRPMLAMAALAAIVVACPGVAKAQWTQWGGPGQAFIAPAKGLADSWPKDGPPKLWDRELGEGYSAILADNGRLYTMYRGQKKETVVSLDAKTGKTIWKYRYNSKPHKDHQMQFGDGPRSTPMIDGDRIYTIGISGVMHCLNKEDGTVYWKHDLWKEFDGSFLPHGYSSSPIGYKDTVIVLAGGEGHSIIAFNKGDGSVAWKNQSFKNSYSTPKILTVDGKDQLVTFMANEIVGLNPNNGDLEWRYEIGNQWGQNICMPVISDDNRIFFSTSHAGARGLKLKRVGDKVETEEIWSTKKVQFYHVTSVQIGDYVYGSTGSGFGASFMAGINIKTGEIAWRERGFKLATCLLADKKLILLDEDGVLALTTATPDGLTVLSQAKVLEKAAWTVPTVVGNTIYLRDKKRIMALDLS